MRLVGIRAKRRREAAEAADGEPAKDKKAKKK